MNACYSEDRSEWSLRSARAFSSTSSATLFRSDLHKMCSPGAAKVVCQCTAERPMCRIKASSRRSPLLALAHFGRTAPFYFHLAPHLLTFELSSTSSVSTTGALTQRSTRRERRQSQRAQHRFHKSIIAPANPLRSTKLIHTLTHCSGLGGAKSLNTPTHIFLTRSQDSLTLLIELITGSPIPAPKFFHFISYQSVVHTTTFNPFQCHYFKWRF